MYHGIFSNEICIEINLHLHSDAILWTEAGVWCARVGCSVTGGRKRRTIPPFQLQFRPDTPKERVILLFRRLAFGVCKIKNPVTCA